MEQGKALMKARKALAALCVALCCVVVMGLAGCGGSSSSSAASASSGSASASSASTSSGAASSGTVSFTDSAGRTVEVPANIERVAITGPISQMCMLTLAPEKMVGLSNELSDAEKKYVGAEAASLPVYGQIYGGKGDFNKEAVANADPQVIIDIGEAKKTIVEDLDEIQAAIGIPCIHIEASYDSYDEAFEQLGKLLGVEDRAKELADYCVTANKTTSDAIASIPEADRVKVAFLHNMSNQMIDPVNAVVDDVDRMCEKSHRLEQQEADRLAADIEQQCKSITTLLNHLLGMSEGVTRKEEHDG